MTEHDACPSTIMSKHRIIFNETEFWCDLNVKL